MAKFVDEELDETPTKTKAAVEETTSKKQRAAVVDDESEEQVVSASVATEADEDDADWGDESLKTFSDGLDRLRPEKGSGNSVRFAILSKADFPGAKLFKKHDTIYIDKKGSYVVLGDDDPAWAKVRTLISTKLDEEPTLTMVQLVLAYTNANKQGKYTPDKDNKLPPIEWKLMYVQLGRTNFKDISELPEEGSKVDDIDIIMSHKNPGGTGGYKFTVGASQARWKKNPALVEEVREAVAKFADGKKLGKKLGKRVTPLELKMALMGIAAAANAEDASLDDIEGLE